MTQEQFLKAESIMKKVREYRRVLSKRSITICDDSLSPIKLLEIESHSDDHKAFEEFIISQINKFEDQLKDI